MEDFLNTIKEQFQDKEISMDDQIDMIRENDIEIESLIENTLNIPELFNNNCVTFNDSLYQDIELFTDHLNNKDNSLFNARDGPAQTGITLETDECWTFFFICLVSNLLSFISVFWEVRRNIFEELH